MKMHKEPRQVRKGLFCFHGKFVHQWCIKSRRKSRSVECTCFICFYYLLGVSNRGRYGGNISVNFLFGWDFCHLSYSSSDDLISLYCIIQATFILKISRLNRRKLPCSSVLVAFVSCLYHLFVWVCLLAYCILGIYLLFLFHVICWLSGAQLKCM